MAIGWNGPDPTGFSDGGGTSYELGTKYTATEDITITHVRVWAPVGGASRTSREGKIWSNAGGSLGTASMPDTLSSGWTTHALAVPVEVTTGTSIIVSYDTTDTYGAAVGGFSYPVASADGAVNAIERRLHATPDNFPPAGVGNTFYGIDIAYTLGIAGNTAPEVGISATTSVLSAAATLTIDDEDPGTVTYAIEWGDGSTTTGLTSLGPHNHTYAAAGTYAIMVTATDAGGLQDSAAVAVTVRAAIPAGMNFTGVLNAVANKSARLGLFAKINKHEPKNAPGAKLTTAIWVQAIGPADSGLASTSVWIQLTQRIYTPMIQDPPDAIDPSVIYAADRIMAALTADHTLGGLVRCIDLLGLESGRTRSPLSAEAGYIQIDNTLYRIMDISIPIVLNDVWEQG